MTEKEVIAKVATDKGITPVEAKELVDYIVGLYVDTAMETGKCTFGKVGTFKRSDVKATEARVGRNPHSGAAVNIAAKPARTKLSFSLSKPGKLIGA